MVYKKIIVEGTVQGVFFRARTKDKADELDIRGEVRNLRDGSVEIVAVGDEASVQKLVEWCHQGPSRAKVTNVTVTDIPKRDFADFRIARG